jgi:hypothetical protein
MSPLPPKADIRQSVWHGRFGSLADITASKLDVLFTPECVAKLFAALRSRNNRIRLDGALNQCCAFAFVLESILLVLAVKIVLDRWIYALVSLSRAAFDFLPLAVRR